MKLTAQQIAEKCLNKYWNKGNMSGILFEVGWDRGSPAHRCSIAWAKRNIRRLSHLTWKQIYQDYLLFLRQE